MTSEVKISPVLCCRCNLAVPHSQVAAVVQVL
jgi:hypothetical protein